MLPTKPAKIAKSHIQVQLSCIVLQSPSQLFKSYFFIYCFVFSPFFGFPASLFSEHTKLLYWVAALWTLTHMGVNGLWQTWLSPCSRLLHELCDGKFWIGKPFRCFLVYFYTPFLLLLQYKRCNPRFLFAKLLDTQETLQKLYCSTASETRAATS